MKRVLFVCIGNTCRSPMAAGFANHYGGDVLIADSAGLAPVKSLARETQAVMAEKNVDISHHVPRYYEPVEGVTFDLVVNMSGYRLPGALPRGLVEWTVKDPFTASVEVYRAVRDDIEQRVMRLILDLRRGAGKRPASAGRR